MTATAFISYSHADEKTLERLHKHLVMLRRDGDLAAWYDRQILPGDQFEQEIKEQLESCELFLALVSPDYLDSNYCYVREFQHALSLAEAGHLRIIPIILEPCDWMSSPLSRFKALPKDGQPISEWINQNNAFLDVVTALRAVIELTKIRPSKSEDHPLSEAREISRRPRLRRDFDAIERSDFADKAYEVIKRYFRGSCDELGGMESAIRAKFEEMSSTAFTCTIVNRAKRDGGDAHITIHNMKGRGHFGGDVNYIYDRYAEPNTSHGSIRVDADEYNLFLMADAFGFGRKADAKLSPEQAAEWLWTSFASQAGVEYE